MRKKTGLIAALDMTDKTQALSISKEIEYFVDAIKVGYPLVLESGLGIIGMIAEFAPVIADFKVADIPNTDKLICRQAFDAGASAVIVHGFTGRDSLMECVNTGREHHGEIYVVTEMSHPGALDFLAPAAHKLAHLAVECGASGIVAPATRPESVRDMRRIVGEMPIISPGVGAQGGSAAEAIRAGADHVIVGRSIYNSKAPGKEAEKLVREIKSACDDRT
ncbi:MAG: orotidine-5'-phosphate decarboxylase [Candidatus Methanoperedens sp.]|nr:orotidine-5'-phosphate decarboxylase [Candidatus Methanoperedens sp.]